MNKVLTKVGGIGQTLFFFGLSSSVIIKVTLLLTILVVVGFILMALAYANSFRVEFIKLRKKGLPNLYTTAMLHTIKEAATDLSIATFMAALTIVFKAYVGANISLASIVLVAVLMPVSVVLGLTAIFAYAMYKAYIHQE